MTHIPTESLRNRFFHGFLEAAFFTSTGHVSKDAWFETDEDTRQMDGSLPADVDADDLHTDSAQELKAFCDRFLDAHADLVAEALNRMGYDAEQAGRDLWFTHNGHGVGYWDRKALEDAELGDRLSDAAGRGDISLFFGDHVTHGDAPFVHATIG